MLIISRFLSKRTHKQRCTQGCCSSWYLLCSRLCGLN